MAILPISDQYKYSKRGPLDAKAIVRTYAELLDPDTWTVNGTMAAYNGMITAVWLNIADTSKNGVYFLNDPTVTSALKQPDVTNEANWHKLDGVSVDISNLVTKEELENYVPEVPSEYITESELDQVLETLVLSGGDASGK